MGHHESARDPLSLSREVLLETVRSLYREVHHNRPATDGVDLTSRLERDLGFDSLARVELLRRLEERLRIELPDTLLVSVETVADLLRACGAARPATAAAPPHAASNTLDDASPADRSDTPQGATTLTEVLDWRATREPEATHAVVLAEGRATPLTYAQLRAGAWAIAGRLQAAGVASGSRIAMMLPTGIDYLRSFFGVLLAGAVPVPLYPPTRASQVEEHVQRHAGILSNAGATHLLTTLEARRVASQLQARVPTLGRVLSVEGLHAGDALEPAHPGPSAQSTALIQYTSGSTGDPKGVVLTHAKLLANVRTIGRAARATHADVFVSWLPLYHDMGLIGAWLGSLYFGCLFVVMPPTAFLLRPERWLRAISEYRGTLSASPNFGYALCAERVAEASLQGLDLSSWRMAFNGAEQVQPQTLERFARRFAPYGFRPQAMTPVYGLAEAAVALTFPPLGRGPRIDPVDRRKMTSSGHATPAAPAAADALRFVSCGYALPGYRLRIVGPDGAEEPERTEGSIQFAGPSATEGYYCNDVATARLRQGQWLSTGDRGYLADGELFVTGRDKDLIIRRGRHIYPEEIEQRVGELADVRSGCVAAFGARDPAAAATERLVVLAETACRDPAERARLQARINECVVERIGEPPEEVVLVPPGTVLKTSSGKLRRAAMRAAYESGSLERPPVRPGLRRLRLAAAVLLASLRRRRRRCAHIAYGVYCWLIVLALGASFRLLVMLAPGRRWAWRLTHAAARSCLAACGIGFAVTGPGARELTQPHIVVANHCSYIDSLLLAALLPTPHRFIAKSELRHIPLLRGWLRRLGTVFIERSTPLESLAQMSRLRQDLAAGDALVVFPEGTFTGLTGLRTFHLAAFELAGAARVPVIPVALRGTRSVLREGRWLPRRLPVSATVGAPLEPAAGGSEFAAAVRLRDAARDEILRNCGEPDLS